MFSTFTNSKTEIYQCRENGTVVFQSKPCKGVGKTVADKLKEEQEAKDKRLAEIQEKEKRLQERLKQQDKKEVGFKEFIISLKKKFSSYWHALKKKFTIDA